MGDGTLGRVLGASSAPPRPQDRLSRAARNFQAAGHEMIFGLWCTAPKKNNNSSNSNSLLVSSQKKKKRARCNSWSFCFFLLWHFASLWAESPPPAGYPAYFLTIDQCFFSSCFCSYVYFCLRKLYSLIFDDIWFWWVGWSAISLFAQLLPHLVVLLVVPLVNHFTWSFLCPILRVFAQFYLGFLYHFSCFFVSLYHWYILVYQFTL